MSCILFLQNSGHLKKVLHRYVVVRGQAGQDLLAWTFTAAFDVRQV